MPVQEIRELENTFKDELYPIKIYLFGSYTDGNYTGESDLDFYIVVRDDITDIPAEIAKAYKAIRRIKKHPVDILVGKESQFEERKNIPSVENEVYHKGILLYDEGN